MEGRGNNTDDTPKNDFVVYFDPGRTDIVLNVFNLLTSHAAKCKDVLFYIEKRDHSKCPCLGCRCAFQQNYKDPERKHRNSKRVLRNLKTYYGDQIDVETRCVWSNNNDDNIPRDRTITEVDHYNLISMMMAELCGDKEKEVIDMLFDKYFYCEPKSKNDVFVCGDAASKMQMMEAMLEEMKYNGEEETVVAYFEEKMADFETNY